MCCVVVVEERDEVELHVYLRLTSVSLISPFPFFSFSFFLHQILLEQQGNFPPGPDRDLLFEPQCPDDTQEQPRRPVVADARASSEPPKAQVSLHACIPVIRQCHDQRTADTHSCLALYKGRCLSLVKASHMCPVDLHSCNNSRSSDSSYKFIYLVGSVDVTAVEVLSLTKYGSVFVQSLLPSSGQCQ